VRLVLESLLQRSPAGTSAVPNVTQHKLGSETFELLENLADSLSEQKLGALALAYLRERLRER